MDFDKLGDLFHQAMSQREQLLEQMDKIVVEADTGGGAVTVRMNGKREVLKLTIAPAAAAAAAGDITMLEDLIAAAINEAGRKAAAAVESASSAALGGLGLRGL
jgi:DNA-binding YbaB/EbfC family protein